jgi:spore germination protein GerM
MSLRRFVALGCLAAVMTAAAGCGIPVNSSPQAIPADEMPLALSEPNATIPSISRLLGSIPEEIYFLGPDAQLVARIRYFSPRPTPQEILDALDAGPAPTELDQGIQSAVPASANLVAGSLSGGVLTVVLDPSFGSLRPGQATYEFAQIVYSVTSLSDVHGVLFEYYGSVIEPEVGNGAIATNYIVHRADYAQLAP